MKKIVVALWFLTLIVVAVYAANRIPLGHGEWTPNTVTRLTDAPDTGVALPANTSTVFMCTENQAIRYRTDFVDPTPLVGTLLAAGACMEWPNERLIVRRIKFIEVAAGAKVTADFYED